MINQVVPPGGNVFAMGPPAEAYIHRDVIVSFLSAEGEELRDILYVPVNPDYQPSWVLTFRFPAQALRALRVVQTAKGTHEDEWSVGEVKLYNGGSQVDRGTHWKLFSNVNPWGLELAFDKNPVTRWGARRAIFNGMQLGIDFSELLTLDTVDLECSHDQWAIHLKLEGEDGAGKWKLLAAEPARGERPTTQDLRRAAMEQFRRRGVTHLLIDKGNFAWADIQKNPEQWGIAEVGHVGDDWLYAIK
jgi:hypothetical protein